MKQAKKSIKHKHAFIRLRTQNRKIFWAIMDIISPSNNKVIKKLDCIDIMKHKGAWQIRKRHHYIDKQTGEVVVVYAK